MINYSTKQIFKKIALYILLTIFLFVFTIEGSVGAFPFGLIFIIIATSISGLIAGLLHGKLNYHRALQASRIVLFLGLCVMVISFTFYKIQINQNFKNATILVNSIDQFKNENGYYPKEIQALVPNYIKTIPKLNLGLFPRIFKYKFSDINDRDLRFEYQNTEINESGYNLIYKGYLGVTYTYKSCESNWKLAN